MRRHIVSQFRSKFFNCLETAARCDAVFFGASCHVCPQRDRSRRGFQKSEASKSGGVDVEKFKVIRLRLSPQLNNSTHRQPFFVVLRLFSCLRRFERSLAYHITSEDCHVLAVAGPV